MRISQMNIDVRQRNEGVKRSGRGSGHGKVEWTMGAEVISGAVKCTLKEDIKEDSERSALSGFLIRATALPMGASEASKDEEAACAQEVERCVNITLTDRSSAQLFI